MEYCMSDENEKGREVIRGVVKGRYTVVVLVNLILIYTHRGVKAASFWSPPFFIGELKNIEYSQQVVGEREKEREREIR